MGNRNTVFVLMLMLPIFIRFERSLQAVSEPCFSVKTLKSNPRLATSSTFLLHLSRQIIHHGFPKNITPLPGRTVKCPLRISSIFHTVRQGFTKRLHHNRC